MKHIKIILLCCMALFLTSCISTNKNYEEGLSNLEIKDYVAAEASFKKALDAGYNKNNINEIYTIVSEYNIAINHYDEGNYVEAGTHADKIPHSYSEYSIGADIDDLKDQLENYDEGISKLEIKDYVAAEASFKKILDNDPDQNNINVIYTIVSEYNNAKKYYDAGEYDTAMTHIDKIPHSYTNYSIGIDVDALKNQLKNIKDIDVYVSKAASLLESGEYSEANEIILKIDTQYSTDKQQEEIKALQKQIQLEKKNQDKVVLEKLDTLVRTYANGLCEAVNTGNFKPLKGTLYKGSSIYAEQVAYIEKMSNIDIFEYNMGAEVSSVDWQSETTCVISTIETYEIYNYTAEDYSTQTFRYTYDVIETPDGQLFLTSIRESN